MSLGKFKLSNGTAKLSPRCWQVTVPAVRRHPPDPEPAPGVHELATLDYGRTVRLVNSGCVAPDFDGHVARLLDPERFHAKILVARFSDSAQHRLDRLRSLCTFALRRHQEAVRSEKGRRLIVVSGIECSGVILRQSADRGLHIQP
jgi:hypothetical protein